GAIPLRLFHLHPVLAPFSLAVSCAAASGTLDPRHPNTIMAQGASVRCGSHAPTDTVQATRRFVSSGQGGPDDEAGPVNRLFGRTSGSAGRPRAAGRRTGLRLGLVGRSLWL